MSFTTLELEYLATQPLARFSTIDAVGQPDVVPVAFECDGTILWIGGTGDSFLTTRKVQNIASGHTQVALVVDDMVSFDPFIARGVRIYGHAVDPIQRTGIMGPGWYVKITPTISWSWNMEGQPAGDDWYPTRRQVHSIPSGEDQ